jgi:hypothetical protein
MLDIEEHLERIQNFDDFIVFLQMLREDFSVNQAEWENASLERFLEGLEAFASATESSTSGPSWKTFAKLLLGATIYE